MCHEAPVDVICKCTNGCDDKRCFILHQIIIFIMLLQKLHADAALIVEVVFIVVYKPASVVVIIAT